ncbi:murein transglycosylase A [Thiohalorhabdus sp.]|uniref:murein transglycosylase A n=1 Tax=Thiohalorhabdus sp. TaxID=3094134 RepID=UPI002FC32C47
MTQTCAVRTGLALLTAVLVGSCAGMGTSPEPGPGESMPWTEVPGWEEGDQAGVWPALLRTCRKLEGQEPWRSLCPEAELYPGRPSNAEVRAFFEGRFMARPVHDQGGDTRGLITGYYEPLLQGSRQPTDRFHFPIYAPPPDLVTIQLDRRFTALAGERVRGRYTPQGRVVPYPTRAEIEGPAKPLAGNELVWVDDPVDRFFLHIQGSGRIQLRDGKVMALDYADQNGHPYVSIGRVLVERGAMEREEVSLPRLRSWLAAHPDERRELFNTNPSYVFFQLREPTRQDPVGSLGVPLTPRRSLAVDPSHIPLGYPVWVATRLPGPDPNDREPPWRQLVLAQDTGGAIRGPVRADLFTGQGMPAEWLAGRMKQEGRLFVLTPAWRYVPGSPEDDAETIADR